MSSSKCCLDTQLQAYLLNLARESIRHGLRHGKPISLDMNSLPATLTAKHATFVTLEKQGELRGCIGMLEAVRPLAADIAHNAYAAAFNDPRFPPLSEDEFDDLKIHISLLTAAEPMQFKSEEDLINQLQPAVDGLILAEGSKRGTFLPSVWEQLPNPKEFLEHLKLKAGLPKNYWSDTLKVYRYRSEVIE